MVAKIAAPYLTLIYSYHIPPPRNHITSLETSNCDTSNPSNYRPILSLVYVVRSWSIFSFSNYEILSDAQFEFHRNYSAELQQIKAPYDFTLCLSNKGQTDAVLLDFSKAFDRMPHHLLLQNYGTCGHLLN